MMRWLLALLLAQPLMAQDSSRTYASSHVDSVVYWRTIRQRPETVKVAASSAPARGIPWGPDGLWTSSTPLWGPQPFSLSTNADAPETIVARITAARALRHSLFVGMTGGNHDRYITAGKFDLAKWKARQDLFRTPVIQAAIAVGVSDGTIRGANILDEPQHISWNGSITKPLLDSMGLYVKGIFPTLPVGVSTRLDTIPSLAWRPQERFGVIDFVVTQYVASYGSVTEWRNRALAGARLNGVAPVFALNIINGGAGFNMTSCPPPTGGFGESGRCRMGPSQLREYALALASGCALIMWRYDPAFMANAENLAVFRVLADSLAARPAKPCKRGAFPS